MISSFVPRRLILPLTVFSILAFTSLILSLRGDISLHPISLSQSDATKSPKKVFDPHSHKPKYIPVVAPYNDPAVDRYVIPDENGSEPPTLYSYVTLLQTTTKTKTKYASVTTATVTLEVEVEVAGATATVTKEVTQYARIRPAKPVPTYTTINRKFERYAGAVEEYHEGLKEGDEEALKEVGIYSTTGKKEEEDDAKLTPRQERLKRMYELDGAEDWTRFVKDNDDSAMPPLTKWAQEQIYKHQHPPKEQCKEKKFIVLQHYWDKNGLGTVVHGTGWILGLAIRTGRILVFNETRSPGRNFFEPGCTMGKNGGDSKGLDCIFERFSSCGEEDVLEGNGIPLKGYWKVPRELNISTSSVPPVFGYALKHRFPEMHEDAVKYWWRTQAAAYTLRMNGPALRRVREMRTDPDTQIGFTHQKNPSANPLESDLVLTQVPVPFPLPDGSFSMHVRHGDKAVEMELIPFAEYVARAEEHAAMNPISSRKIGFISSENPLVFEQARSVSNFWMSTNTTSNTYWTWIYSDIPRINGGPVEQLEKFGNRTDTTIKWMSQLFFAIEASNILGTRGSGWNRMVDEVRCVWMDCRGGYMEVGPFEDWVHYNF